MKFIVGKSLYFLGQRMFNSPYLDIERKTKTSTKYVKKTLDAFVISKESTIFNSPGESIA